MLRLVFVLNYPSPPRLQSPTSVAAPFASIPIRQLFPNPLLTLCRVLSSTPSVVPVLTPGCGPW